MSFHIFCSSSSSTMHAQDTYMHTYAQWSANAITLIALRDQNSMWPSYVSLARALFRMRVSLCATFISSMQIFNLTTLIIRSIVFWISAVKDYIHLIRSAIRYKGVLQEYNSSCIARLAVLAFVGAVSVSLDAWPRMRMCQDFVLNFQQEFSKYTLLTVFHSLFYAVNQAVKRGKHW